MPKMARHHLRSADSAGIFVGSILLQGGGAQSSPVRSLNHVGIVVKNYDAEMAFLHEDNGFSRSLHQVNQAGSKSMKPFSGSTKVRRT